MEPLIILLVRLLDIYLYIVIASVIISWLVAFDVLNMRNKWAYKAVMLINGLTEPLQSRIRKVIPAMGGIDLSPLVVIIGISVAQALLLGLL